jgi:hypothetical protein
MRQPTQEGLQVLRRAHEFLAASDVTAALGPITKHVEALGQQVDRLATHAVDQYENERGYRASAGAARAKVRTLKTELMRPIARMSQSLFPDDAELRQALAMPKNRGYEKLLAAALAMAGRAAEHKARFVQVGFAEDFLDRLKNGASDLRAALDEKGAHYGKRSAATAGMLQELSRSKELMRVLDDMVTPGLRATPDRLAEWRTLSRFARVSRVAEDVITPPESGAPDTPPAALPVVVPAATTVVPLVAPTPPSLATDDGAVVDRAA